MVRLCIGGVDGDGIGNVVENDHVELEGGIVGTHRPSARSKVRLRTSHVALNEYQHRSGHKEEPICECGEENETVEHFLLKCKMYTAQRVIYTSSHWPRSLGS